MSYQSGVGQLNSSAQFEGSPLNSAFRTKGTEKNHGIFTFILKCPLHSVNSPKCLYRKNKVDVQSLKRAIAKKSTNEKRPQRSFCFVYWTKIKSPFWALYCFWFFQVYPGQFSSGHFFNDNCFRTFKKFANLQPLKVTAIYRIIFFFFILTLKNLYVW